MENIMRDLMEDLADALTAIATAKELCNDVEIDLHCMTDAQIELLSVCEPTLWAKVGQVEDILFALDEIIG